MVTLGQALDVAAKCVDQALNFTGKIQWEYKMKKLGMRDDNDKSMLVTTIVNDKQIGLPSIRATIDANAFSTFSNSSTFTDLVDILYDHAV